MIFENNFYLFNFLKNILICVIYLIFIIIINKYKYLKYYSYLFNHIFIFTHQLLFSTNFFN